MKKEEQTIFFAPHLALINVLDGMDFYKKAFNAIELRKWSNEDGSVHVAEMTIGNALFHLHEESPGSKQLSPQTTKSVSSLIGLFVPDTDALVNQAITAGATLLNPLQDFDYGYRQAVISDPFGHQWLIQKRI